MFRPDLAEADARRPETERPPVARPSLIQPGVASPATGQPSVAPAATSQPATGQPATGQPAVARSETLHAEASRAEPIRAEVEHGAWFQAEIETLDRASAPVGGPDTTRVDVAFRDESTFGSLSADALGDTAATSGGASWYATAARVQVATAVAEEVAGSPGLTEGKAPGPAEAPGPDEARGADEAHGTDEARGADEAHGTDEASRTDEASVAGTAYAGSGPHGAGTVDATPDTVGAQLPGSGDPGIAASPPSALADVRGSAGPETSDGVARYAPATLPERAVNASQRPDMSPAPDLAPGRDSAQGRDIAPRGGDRGQHRRHDSRAGDPQSQTGAGDGPVESTEPGRPGCTTPQLRRFIKSRAYVPMHELRRRFAIDGPEDDVTRVDTDGGRVFIGLPEREGHMIGELVRQGEIGFELSLDPSTPIVIGVYPMRPVIRN